MESLVTLLLTVVTMSGAEADRRRAVEWPDRRVPCPQALDRMGEPYVPKGAYDARRLLGMHVVRARVAGAWHGCEVRIVRVDGRMLGRNDDFRVARVNVAVQDGRVVALEGVF